MARTYHPDVSLVAALATRSHRRHDYFLAPPLPRRVLTAFREARRLRRWRPRTDRAYVGGDILRHRLFVHGRGSGVSIGEVDGVRRLRVEQGLRGRALQANDEDDEGRVDALCNAGQNSS